MKFTVREMDAGAQGQQSSTYHTQSSSSSSAYSYFTEQAIRAGFPSGNFGVGGHIGVGPEIHRRRSEMREAIQREIEKQRIREEIIAEEMARRRILEEEVRNELRMERELMSVRRGEGFSSPFMPLSPPPSHNNLFEPRILLRQPIGLEDRIVTSLEGKYVPGSHRREVRGFEVPFQRFGNSPKIEGIPTTLSEDTKKEVVVLGKPCNGETWCGTKRKSTPPVAACSSGPHSDGSKKKLKEEWSCAICQVCAPSERVLNEHLQGKKHQNKEAALIAQKTGANFGLGVAPKKPIVKPLRLAITTVNLSSLEKRSKTSSSIDSNKKKEGCMNRENSRDKFKYWCEMCQVGGFSEKVMKKHKEGKKHLTKLVQLLQKGKVESEKTCDIKEEIETETKAVVGEVVAAEVKPAEGDEPDTLVEADGMNKTQKRDKFKYWCEMCQVGGFSETVMKNHKEGKKHLTNLVEVLQKGEVESENTHGTEEKTEAEAETKTAVVVEVGAAVKDENQDITAKVEEVKTIKYDKQDVTAKDTVAEEDEGAEEADGIVAEDAST